MHECPICTASTTPVGAVTGRWSGRTFHVRRCDACRFAFVADPWTDFAQIYSDDYYAGRGADPLVDYVHELDHPASTIRQYEWQGIAEVVGRLAPVGPDTRWLDYGCGTGGLVLRLREAAGVQAFGFEEGWSVPRLVERGVPILDREGLDAAEGTFDVLTAIEVLEHIPDPVAELRRMARLLRPGGTLFVTTGNAAPRRDDLLSWPYVIPEIHVSFFEPANLALAMRRAGLETEFPGYGPGWDRIIRFKALKNLKRRDVSALDRLIPWRLAAPVLDRRHGVSAHPVGRRPADPQALERNAAVSASAAGVPIS